MMQSPQSEPMAMGSPQSPMSPGATHGQHQYLPAFLMGEPASVAASPSSSRLWTGGNSPPQNSHLNRSVNWAAQTNSAAGTPSGLASQSMFSQSPRPDIRSGRGKEKSGAPPVQGLLESIHTATPSSGKKQGLLDGSQNVSFRQITGSFTPVQSGLHTPGPTYTPTGPYSHNRKTPPSPAQMDPFYTQGESLRADDELNETWVTVFGFPPAATSYILQQFSHYGSIVKHVIASDGNWMHIQFQSKFQAKKALSKNGKVFGGSIMVGVKPCIEKNVMECDKENAANTSYKTSFLGTPTQGKLPPACDKHNTSQVGPIRPLTAAYRAASSDHEVLNQGNAPQKHNGMINKAMEYVFGW